MEVNFQVDLKDGKGLRNWKYEKTFEAFTIKYEYNLVVVKLLDMYLLHTIVNQNLNIMNPDEIYLTKSKKTKGEYFTFLTEQDYERKNISLIIDCFAVKTEEGTMQLIANIDKELYLLVADPKLVEINFFDPKYNLKKELGAGTFGTVWEAVDAYGTKWAIKKVVRKKAIEEATVANNIIKLKLDHPNIMKIVDVIDFGDYIWIVNEHIPGITLTEYINNSEGGFNADLLYGIADAINYLHSKGWIHRDIKPDNIMLKNGDIPIIIDFGLSCSLTESTTIPCHGKVGSPRYMDPLVMDKTVKDWFKADIYSLGTMFYYLISKRNALYANTAEEIYYEKIKNNYIPLSTQYNRINLLINLMIQADPIKRPSLKQLLTVLKDYIKFVTMFEQGEKQRFPVVRRKIFKAKDKEGNIYIIRLVNNKIKQMQKLEDVVVFLGKH